MQKKSGFTLLELMVVIAIIGVLATVTAPAVDRWLEQRGVHEATVQLAETMQRTKLLAIRSSTSCSIMFPANTLYVVMTGNPVRFDLIWLDDYRGGVTITNDPGNGNAPPAMVTFTPQGLATIAGGPGSIVFTSTPGKGSQKWLRVRVSQAGGISLQRWDNTNNRWFVVT